MTMRSCSRAKAIRLNIGPLSGPVATDGPYAEAKEYLAGYYVIDAESPATRSANSTIDRSRSDRSALAAIRNG